MANPSPFAGNPTLVAMGAAIRSSRKKRQISQEDLAERSEIERARMSGIERGSQNPGLMSLYRIARALDMTLADLMAEANL